LQKAAYAVLARRTWDLSREAEAGSRSGPRRLPLQRIFGADFGAARESLRIARAILAARAKADRPALRVVRAFTSGSGVSACGRAQRSLRSAALDHNCTDPDLIAQML